MYSRFFIGLLNGHNTLRIHLHFKGLFDSPLGRRCGAEKKTSAHVLCECKDLATLRYTYFGSSLFDPEDVRGLILGQSRTSVKEQSCHDLDIRLGVKRAFPKGLGASGPKAQTHLPFYSILFYSILFYSILFYSSLL